MNRKSLCVAVAVVALAAAGCSSSHPSTKATGPAPAAGSAKVTVAGQAVALSVQRCVQNGTGGLNLTAVGAKDPSSTLTVNLGKPVGSSTLVFTTKKADNSFTNYSLASTVTKKPIVGGQTGDRVTLSGQAVEQAYTPSGKTDGAATKQAVVVDASCRVVEPEQPAPSFAPPKKKSTPTTKPNAAKTN